jgi:hypothetical protein
MRRGREQGLGQRKDERVNVAVDTIAGRTQGERPSMLRSALTAALIGGAAAVLTYRLLRRPDGETGTD